MCSIAPGSRECHTRLKITRGVEGRTRKHLYSAVIKGGNVKSPFKTVLCRSLSSSKLTLARKGCFATFAGVGGGGCDPPGVSKRSVVELRGKDQQIALAEYSRLVVLFLVLGQYLTQLWQVKGQIFGNSVIF